MRFRTKIVEVDAVQFTGDNHDALLEFTEFNWQATRVTEDGEQYTGLVYDFLHDTWIKVKEGQWIVRGAKGEYYPCDDETFHWKYEPVAVGPWQTLELSEHNRYV